ncbi:MAG: ATP-binding protein [Candidatus Acidiferrales bacterium]
MPDSASDPESTSPSGSMFGSMRVRLTLWYSAVLAVALLLLSLTIYWIVRKSMMERTDADLAQLASSFLTTFNAELKDAENPGGILPAARQAMIEHNYRDHTFAILDGSGAVVANSRDLLGTGGSPVEGSAIAARSMAPDSLPACVAATAAPDHPFRTVSLSRHQFRCYSSPFTAERNNYHLLIVQSLHAQREVLERVSLAFGWLIPLALLLAATGGYFLARKSLAPVLAMSVQTSRITASNLHERLAVQNSSGELGRLATTFNRLLDRLDQAFDRQRRFIADASHELRTPVAILRGEAEVAIAQPSRTAAEYREFLIVLHDEATRLAKIVEDLFTLTRADSGQHLLSSREFYLDELVAECARAVRTLADARRISLTVDASPDLQISADEALLRRMLINLLDNAIKYTRPGGAVRISCRASFFGVEIAVADNGPGIPAALHTRIFERFFRVDPARSRGTRESAARTAGESTSESGAGLGLSIARWIAEAHDGRLELSRSDAAGSTFTAFLPRDARPAPSDR